MIKTLVLFLFVALTSAIVYPVPWRTSTAGAQYYLAGTEKRDQLRFDQVVGFPHNIVKVNESVYDTCNITSSAEIFGIVSPVLNTTQSIVVDLANYAEGMHYFICTVGTPYANVTFNGTTYPVGNRHCNNGMRLAIYVSNNTAPGSADDLEKREYCGFPAGQQANPDWNGNINYPNGHACSALNGLLGDSATWRFSDAEDAQMFYDTVTYFINNATSSYQQFLRANGNIEPCASCVAAYQHYLCMALTPQPGFSSCFMNLFWKDVRANYADQCANNCIYNYPCDVNNPPTGTCCWCNIEENDSCYNATDALDLFFDYPEEIQKCMAVPRSVCTRVLSHCLQPSDAANVANVCNNAFPEVNGWTGNWEQRIPNTAGNCNASFTNLLTIAGSKSEIPTLVMRNCTFRNVTSRTKTKEQCRTRKFMGKTVGKRCRQVVSQSAVPPRRCCAIGNAENCFTYQSSGSLPTLSALLMGVIALFVVLI